MPQLRTTGPTAAIAGIAPGVQSQGIWCGRRQLFVRFAAEAETAVLYTSEMLARQLSRSVEQSALHSISLCGRDPLASAGLIAAALDGWRGSTPIMLDIDGQRPEALPEVLEGVTLVQVTLDFSDGVAPERVLASLVAAGAAGKEHAVALAPRDGTSDAQLLRFVEQTHAAAPGTKIVVHPPTTGSPGSLDRRYATLLEQAMGIHREIQLTMLIPTPAGTR